MTSGQRRGTVSITREDLTMGWGRWMLVLGGALVVAVAPAAGSGVKIVQKDFGFSEKEVRVRVGDRVTFENQDPVTHNVYSLTKGMEFEIRTQAPGQSDVVAFKQTGTAQVLCAIHPR